MKFFLAVVVLFSSTFFCLPDARAEDQQNREETVLSSLIDEALARNPDLQAAQARWQMFERRTVPAGTLSDPVLSFALMNYPVDSLSGDETPMTGNELRLAQKFPFPGKLGSKSEVARQQARWYRGVYEDTRLKLVRQVKDAWYRLYYQDKAIETTRKNLRVLEDFTRLTETRYEVGEGLQQDVLKAQVEHSKLTDRLLTLKQKRESTAAELNSLLDRPTTTPIAPDATPTLSEVEPTLEDLQQRSIEARPLYASYRALMDRFKAQREVAKLDYYPDVTVWGGYRFRQDSDMDPADGTDFVSAGVSVNLPIFREKRSEEVAEAESGLRMAQQQFENFRTRVYNGIHDAYAQQEKDRQLALLYKTGIIPQANQALQSAVSAYQVGKVEFLTLLDALLKLYRYELDYYRAVTDHERAIARLEAESGFVLDGEPITNIDENDTRHDETTEFKD